jgi:hypothetical protein
VPAMPYSNGRVESTPDARPLGIAMMSSPVCFWVRLSLAIESFTAGSQSALVGRGQGECRKRRERTTHSERRFVLNLAYRSSPWASASFIECHQGFSPILAGDAHAWIRSDSRGHSPGHTRCIWSGFRARPNTRTWLSDAGPVMVGRTGIESVRQSWVPGFQDKTSTFRNSFILKDSLPDLV